MKKPHVLNRAMFNRGGTSAYGRGITSNLVSDEQRQRFNYGGRVGARDGFYSGNEFDPIERTAPAIDWQNLFPQAADLFGYRGRLEIPEWQKQRERQEELAGLEDPLEYQTGQDDLLKTDQVIQTTDKGDVMTDSDWMELLGPTEKQKRTTKGKTQLGLAAGALDVFSRPTTAKKMPAAVPHLTKLGETATADQAARDKAILQGKVLEKVYKGREESKGEQARKTLDYKTGLLKQGSPSERFYAEVQSADAVKPSTIKNALWNATEGKVIAEIMPEKKKADAELADPKNEGKIYIQGQTAYIIKNGVFEIINYEDIFKDLKV